MSVNELTISPTAIHAESSHRIKGQLWTKIEKVINETFRLLRTFSDQQNLTADFCILRGPYHFHITLDEEKGLVVFFAIRCPSEPQRIYAEDIRQHSIVSISGTKENLQKEHGFSSVYHIQFFPWEFERINKALKCARIKALEFVSSIAQQRPEGRMHPTLDFSFPVVDAKVDPKLVFVLMPMNESWSDRIWKRYLKRIIQMCKLIPRRADDLNGMNVINDIWRSIACANIVVADLTGKNPNVYYELGLAHALRKKTILLSQDDGDIPFDLRPYRHIFYEDNSDGYEVLKTMLTKSLIVLSQPEA